MLRTYGMPYSEVMNLPMRVFWELSGQVDRLRAEEARLTMHLGVAWQSKEASEQMFTWLNKNAPDAIKLTGKGKAELAEPDEEGINDLRALANGF